jgi:hypothetical protein
MEDFKDVLSLLSTNSQCFCCVQPNIFTHDKKWRFFERAKAAQQALVLTGEKRRKVKTRALHQKHSVPTMEHKGKSSVVRLAHKVKICSRPHKGRLAPSIKFDEQTRISVVPVRPTLAQSRANNNFLFQNRNNNRIDGVASRLLAWINTRCLPYHLSLMLPRAHTIHLRTYVHPPQPSVYF